MNSHAEHDTSDLTCKDCGNEYRTRKSLHVHRMKKHPRIPNPSTCELCNKVFFDETELVCHLKTHSNEEVFFHLREKQKQLKQETTQSSQMDDDDDDPEASSSDQAAAAAAAAALVAAAVSAPFPETIDEESLSCHICGQSFQDKRVLSKHLRMHENEAETLADNPLAAMLSDTQIGGVDDNGSDYNYPTYQGQMVDGQYACDMCPKTFPVINALKVHRGWHFRSPDGRQVTDPSNMWQPDSIPQSKQRRSRMSNPPVCPYCKSTFASGNNLRRHIVEVHKRNEAKMARENGTVSDSVYIEKELECHTCGITFNTRPEWVDHKIQHARTMKPSTTFEWGCEICGKVFTRKERLLAHMVGHLNGKEDDGSVHSAGQQSGEMGDSRSSISSQSQSQQSQESSSVLQQKLQQQMQHRQKQMLKHQQQQQERQRPVHQVGDEPQLQPDYEDDDEMDEEEDEDEDAVGMNADDDEDDDFNNDQKSLSEKSQPAYSCDLCQVFFHTAKELRRHVTSHIITTAPETSTAETQSKPSAEESSTKNPAENVKGDDDEQDDEEEDDVDDDDDSGGDERMEIGDKPQHQVNESNAMEHDDDDYNSDDGDENEESAKPNHDDSQRNDEDEDEDEEEDDEDEDDDYQSNAQKNKKLTAEQLQQSQQLQRHQQHTRFNTSSISVEGYKCRLCGKNTASALDMIQCMENHKTPNNSRCNECLLYFSDSNRLRLHENMCHPKNFF